VPGGAGECPVYDVFLSWVVVFVVGADGVDAG
jgi:hypothetical protein